MAQWLTSIKLAKYIQNFKDHEIDGCLLKLGLDDQTLTMMGIEMPLHRRKLMEEQKTLFPVLATGIDLCFTGHDS